MTAFEAARLELEIKYCKKLERTLADLCQELENLKREATGEEVEEEERKGEKDDPLHSSQAMAMWRRLQEEGLVDCRLKPQMNRTHSSILAYAISEALSLSQFWTPFEELWGIKNLRCHHSNAVNCKYYPQLMERFRSILGIK